MGKAILFADRRSTLPPIDLEATDPARRAIGERPSVASFGLSWIADVPADGLAFDAGEPVLTVMAKASTLEGCELLLQDGMTRWRSRLLDAPG